MQKVLKILAYQRNTLKILIKFISVLAFLLFIKMKSFSIYHIVQDSYIENPPSTSKAIFVDYVTLNWTSLSKELESLAIFYSL